MCLPLSFCIPNRKEFHDCEQSTLYKFKNIKVVYHRFGPLEARSVLGMIEKSKQDALFQGGGRCDVVPPGRRPGPRGFTRLLSPAREGDASWRPDDRNLVDPASSHTLVSKIKPCMSKYKHYTVKLRMAHYISYSLFDSPYYLDNRSNSRANTCVKSHPGCIY